MNTPQRFSDRPATVADYLAVVRRRKGMIIVLPIVAALVAYFVSARQPPVYKASAQILFQLGNIPTQLANLPGFVADPNYMETQANIADSADLAEQVVAKAGVPGETAGAFSGQSSANAEQDKNILDLSVSASTAERAARLTNTYADEFKSYRADLYMQPIKAQLRRYDADLKVLRAKGQSEGSSYQSILENKLNLESFGGQLADNAIILHRAGGGAKVSPQPRRNAVLGGLLGVILGIGLAFLVEALDKRIRDEREIEEQLQLPLLGRVPRPTRRLRRSNQLVMLSEPESVRAQAFRKLRTTLEFVNLEAAAKTIMITSGAPGEGKSTTVANLAVTLARAGGRVALVDFDLRRPSLHTFFHLGSGPGATDVIVGRTPLNRAMRSIALTDASALPEAPTAASSQMNGSSPAASTGNGRINTGGILNFLPSGTIPPAADEFLERPGVNALLAELRDGFDTVLIDAPPLLAVPDAQTLSSKVDAVAVVTEVGIHRRQLEEFIRQLKNCRAPVLGFILTGTAHADSYTYGYGYDPHVYAEPQRTEDEPETIERQP